MAEKEKVPLQGVPDGEFQNEELKDNHKLIVEEKLKIISQLNEIKVPLQATVFAHGKTWNIRNIAFWQVFKKGDSDIVEFMEKYLQEIR